MRHSLLVAAAVQGFLGVAAGAFGAHALKSRLSADLMSAFQTGVLYHLIHAVALAVVAVMAAQLSSDMSRWAGWLFVAGVVLFSGSLYALALSGVRAFGMVTPVGGLFFLAGWICLGIAAWRG